MGRETAIQWCDSTANPTMGCDGCELWNGRGMTQTQFQITSKAPSQADIILRELRNAGGEWVAMPDLWKASGADLRKRGHVIEHKNERQDDGAIHSFYRLTE